MSDLRPSTVASPVSDEEQAHHFWVVQYFARGERTPAQTIAAGFTNRYMARRYAEEVAAGAGAPRGPQPWTDGTDGAQYLVTSGGTYVIGRDHARETQAPT